MLTHIPVARVPPCQRGGHHPPPVAGGLCCSLVGRGSARLGGAIPLGGTVCVVHKEDAAVGVLSLLPAVWERLRRLVLVYHRPRVCTLGGCEGVRVYVWRGVTYTYIHIHMYIHCTVTVTIQTVQTVRIVTVCIIIIRFLCCTVYDPFIKERGEEGEVVTQTEHAMQCVLGCTPLLMCLGRHRKQITY